MIMAVRTWLGEVAAAHRRHSTDDYNPRAIEIAGFHALLELLPADSETCEALLNGGLKDPVVQEVIRAANTNLDTGESGCPTCTDPNTRLAFAAGEPTSEAVRIGRHYNEDIVGLVCDRCNHDQENCGSTGHGDCRYCREAGEEMLKRDAEETDEQPPYYATAYHDHGGGPCGVWCACGPDGPNPACSYLSPPSPCYMPAPEYACVRCASPGRLDATGPDGYADSCPNCRDDAPEPAKRKLDAVDEPPPQRHRPDLGTDD
jgi:hypothetical protein